MAVNQFKEMLCFISIAEEYNVPFLDVVFTDNFVAGPDVTHVRCPSTMTTFLFADK